MTFAVTLAGAVPADDDHGTGLAATLLPLDRPLAGRLSDMGDVDAFRIDLIAAARIEVRTSGGTDTRGRLLDGSGAVRAEDEDSGPGDNFRLVAALEPGAHYVEVQGAPGEYSVTARPADALDQAETEAASTLLTLHDEEVRGATPILLGASGRIWPSVSDVDVFRLDVPHDGTDVTVRSSGRAALRARLVDSSRADIASVDRGGNIRMERRLDAGIYYVAVDGDEVAPYRLLATGVATSDPCARRPVARDDGDSPASSTVLQVGGPPTAGVIADDADVDVFRLDLEGSAQVELRTSGSTDTRGELYDRRGELIASDWASGSGGHNFRIVAELAVGIYYVAVKGAPGARGSYSVSARLGGAFDHPATLRSATRLQVHDALDLARVTPDMLLGTAGRIWPSAADVDAFRLDVPRDGTVVRARTSGGTALHARLVRAGEPSVAVASDDSGGNIDLETPLDAGVYYLVVGGHETGAYRLLAWSYEPGFAPPDKAAFDGLVAGRSLSGPFIETVRFCSARRLKSRTDYTLPSGSYTYERGACPHTGWLELEHGDGDRCTALLSFDSADSGTATYTCDDGSAETSRFSILGGGAPARIPDRRLADEIRDLLGRRRCDDEPISVAEMASLRYLDASAEGVRDLTGLEHATALTRLDLYGNDISDLKPLTGLTSLTVLNLQRNEISDLRPLTGLVTLDRLGLRENRISDLKPLAGMTSLTGLSLGDNAISDLWPLAGLAALDWLTLGDNRISDLQPLAGMTSLTELYLDRNAISDLWPLAELAALDRLTLGDNRISDLSALAGLTSLTVLDLDRNEISDLWPLAELAALRWLILGDNRISDLSPLAGLTSLTQLDLGRNEISDLSPLGALTAVDWITLGDNRISDLQPLAGLTRLRGVFLSHNSISDLSPLAELPALFHIGLADNDISDLAPLSRLSVGQLDLSHNEISDLSPLADMSLVDREDFPGLYFQGNRITDASPLLSLQSSASYYGGRTDLGHNAITQVPKLHAATLDLAGNRIASLESSPRYSLNVEGNMLNAAPRVDSGDLTALRLGGNAISDVGSLLEDHRHWVTNYSVGVSLWRNPLSRLAREEQLPRLRGLEYPIVSIQGGGQLIPLVADTPAPGHAERRGVLRLTNPGSEADAWLYAPRLGDDARPTAVVLSSGSVVHVDAEDVRRGARDKRVYGELPIGAGDAVLEVYSSRKIRAKAYIRTADGFLTSVHDTAPADAAGRHTVSFFNPASNTRQRSLLRLVNMGGEDTEVSVTGVDDAGVRRGPVKVRLAARASVVLDAEALESGTGTGLSGRLGDGEGRWRLEASSDGSIAVMSLVDGPTGHLTNLSTVAAENAVTLFPSASHPRHSGRVRVVNRGGATELNIRGIDDTGTAVGPLGLRIGPGQAVEFDSGDWENGNASIGLVRGVGRGTGDWRLRFASEGDILVAAYVETDDGFLTSMHDHVPGSPSDCLPWWPRWHRCRSPAATYAVAPFMPPGGDGPASSVRFANDGDDDAAIAIWRVDETGNRAGPVDLTLATGTARTVSARELVEGGEDLTGWLRNSAGTWELEVQSSGGRVRVVNLLEDASGHVANLSTAPYLAVIDEYR